MRLAEPVSKKLRSSAQDLIGEAGRGSSPGNRGTRCQISSILVPIRPTARRRIRIVVMEAWYRSTSSPKERRRAHRIREAAMNRHRLRSVRRTARGWAADRGERAQRHNRWTHKRPSISRSGNVPTTGGGWAATAASEDTRLWVPKRNPRLGWTINFAHPAGRWTCLGLFTVPIAFVMLFVLLQIAKAR